MGLVVVVGSMVVAVVVGRCRPVGRRVVGSSRRRRGQGRRCGLGVGRRVGGRPGWGRGVR